MAAVNGLLSAFHDDIAYSNTKEVWIRYISEARIGEEVMTSCWEDENNCCIIWVEFKLTNGSKVIGHCQLEFYEESMQKEMKSVPSANL